MEKKQVLKLSNTIVRRSVPMTERGSDMLRAARNFIIDEMYDQTGVEYEAPFPVVFHLVLKDYCESKGLEVSGKPRSVDAETGSVDS